MQADIAPHRSPLCARLAGRRPECKGPISWGSCARGDAGSCVCVCGHEPPERRGSIQVGWGTRRVMQADGVYNDHPVVRRRGHHPITHAISSNAVGSSFPPELTALVWACLRSCSSPLALSRPQSAPRAT